MKFWQSVLFADTQEILEIAKLAEELGFEGVIGADHVMYLDQIESKYPYRDGGDIFWTPETHWPDPWVSAGAMAAVTERVRFTHAVYILPLRDPYSVAKSVSTAAVLSKNRVALTIGIGWMREEFDLMGESFTNRGRRTDEMIEVLRKLWGGGLVEHHGEFYDFEGLAMSPAPSEEVPIYVGGHSEPALARAATLGDGWVGLNYMPEDVPPILKRLKELRREAGRDHLPYEVMLALTQPPDIDTYRRLEDKGVTGIFLAPWWFWGGPFVGFDEKVAAMHRFHDEVLSKMECA